MSPRRRGMLAKQRVEVGELVFCAPVMDCAREVFNLSGRERGLVMKKLKKAIDNLTLKYEHWDKT
jgi:hypothetical protein